MSIHYFSVFFKQNKSTFHSEILKLKLLAYSNRTIYTTYMQKKIYVVGMFDDDTATKVQAAVSAVAGVTSCATSTEKSQVLVDFDESASGIEDAINAAISGTGVEVLG